MKRSNCDFVLLLEKYSEIGGKMGGGVVLHGVYLHMSSLRIQVLTKRKQVYLGVILL